MYSSSCKTALVVEGGGMRGIFSTGVLDGFLERRFDPFDLFVGVSAGAANIAAYLAGMHGRNRKIYTDLSTEPEFINVRRFLCGGHLMDLDWLWGETLLRMRLDLPRIFGTGRPFLVGMTDVATGRTVYKKTSRSDLEHVLKASSALPVVYRGFPVVDGRLMTDGGVSDPIPVAEAIRRGTVRIMVIRTRPREHRSNPDVLSLVVPLYLRKYPALRCAFKRHDLVYNKTRELLRRPPSGVSIIEICPPGDFQPGRFTRDVRVLDKAYEQGRAAAEDGIAQWARCSGV
jgi:predicted patatin/cPLA2 family phospholipase